jgi:hypothetical protein
VSKVQSKNAILYDIGNDAGPLRDAIVDAIGEGTTTDSGLISAADKTKLDGIAAGATANDTDASLRDRTTHTGEQAIETITGLATALAGKATPADVAAALAGLVDSSPTTLDTLNELAAALGDDPAFATTVSTALGNRLRVDAAQGLTDPQKAQGRDNLGLGSAALAASGDFATAAQGGKADTAVQPGDLTTVFVSDRTTLAALTASTSLLAFSREAASPVDWPFDGSDLSAKVALDVNKIGFVAPTADPTGATGAWRRNLRLSRIYPEDGGVFGNDTDDPNAMVNMQRAADFAAREGCVLRLKAGGLYRIPGFLATRSHLYFEREAGAVLRQTEWSYAVAGGGQFFGNVYYTTDPNEMVQEDVRFDLEIDGSLLQRPTYGYAVSATSNTIVLPANFDGKIRPGKSLLTVVFGTGGGNSQIRRVQSWDAGTRTATLYLAWTTIPDTTSFVGEGGNDNAMAIARGVRNFSGRIFAHDYPTTWLSNGSGGKAFNAEKGCRDIDIEIIAKRCGWGGFIQAVPGVFVPGEGDEPYTSENIALGNNRMWSRDIRLRIDAEDCESAFGLFGLTSDSDPLGDGNISKAIVDVSARNCGHSVSRPLATTTNVKSGIITIGEGQNARIHLQSVIDSDFAPVWPEAGQPFAGAGLSGGVGAVVHGWGPDVHITGTHIGPVDSLWMLDNVRTMGDDAGPTGVPQNVYGFDLDLRHRSGSQPTNGLFWQRNTIANVANTEIAARLKADVDYWPTTIIGNDLAFDNVHVEVHARLAGNNEQRGARGPASQIRAKRNDLSVLTGFRSLDIHHFERGLSVAGNVIEKILTATKAHDFGTVTAHSGVSTTVTVAGVTIGSGTGRFVNVTFNGSDPAGLVFSARVTADDTVTIYCFNTTAASVVAGNRTYSVMVSQTTT